MSRDFILIFSGGMVSLVTTLIVLFVADYLYRRAQTQQSMPTKSEPALVGAKGFEPQPLLSAASASVESIKPEPARVVEPPKVEAVRPTEPAKPEPPPPPESRLSRMQEDNSA